MRLVIALIIVFSIFSKSKVFSQELKTNTYNISDLKQKALNSDNDSKSLSKADNKDLNINLSSSSQKSPGLALLFSLIIPGAGQYYINRFDVGKYYLGVDIGAWIGYAALNIYGDNVSDQSKTYSVQHAEVGSIDDKDEDFFTNIGAFRNVYDYNNYQLSVGNYGGLYNVNTDYWNWDLVDNQYVYETQRRDSERIYNNRIIFGSILLVNRIVSGISAYVMTKDQNKKTSALNVMPQLLYNKDYGFDGVKINLSKNF